MVKNIKNPHCVDFLLSKNSVLKPFFSFKIYHGSDSDSYHSSK